MNKMKGKQLIFVAALLALVMPCARASSIIEDIKSAARLQMEDQLHLAQRYSENAVNMGNSSFHDLNIVAMENALDDAKASAVILKEDISIRARAIRKQPYINIIRESFASATHPQNSPSNAIQNLSWIDHALTSLGMELSEVIPQAKPLQAVRYDIYKRAVVAALGTAAVRKDTESKKYHLMLARHWAKEINLDIEDTIVELGLNK